VEAPVAPTGAIFRLQRPQYYHVSSLTRHHQYTLTQSSKLSVPMRHFRGWTTTLHPNLIPLISPRLSMQASEEGKNIRQRSKLNKLLTTTTPQLQQFQPQYPFNTRMVPDPKKHHLKPFFRSCRFPPMKQTFYVHPSVNCYITTPMLSSQTKFGQQTPSSTRTQAPHSITLNYARDLTKTNGFEQQQMR
jgi:hypothetical protein